MSASAKPSEWVRSRFPIDEDFLRALDGHWGDLADGEAGFHAVAVAQAVYQSQNTGDPVRPETV